MSVGARFDEVRQRAQELGLGPLRLSAAGGGDILVVHDASPEIARSIAAVARAAGFRYVTVDLEALADGAD